jgi:hypothetical protein
VPAYKAEYSYYLDKLIDKIYKESVLFPHLDSLKLLLAPYVADDIYYTEIMDSALMISTKALDNLCLLIMYRKESNPLSQAANQQHTTT